MAKGSHPSSSDLGSFLPRGLKADADIDRLIPTLAKNPSICQKIEESIQRIPTAHDLRLGDARDLGFLRDSSIHLIVTSPPYWTLKEYEDTEGQLGHVTEYAAFLAELAQVWRECHRVLVPGGRLIVVVGDVCLSRRANKGRHTVVPLHASIQESCRHIGYDNLAPIIWHKIANAVYEVGGAGGFLGKPYEPNSVIKNDIEFILMERKAGGYRKPSAEARLLSVIPDACHKEWFQQIWTGVTGASTREHPAPYPVLLAERLIRMFSFVGDTVLDPFMGSGTTSVAASRCGRNSVGTEICQKYLDMAAKRLRQESQASFGKSKVQVTGDVGQAA